MANILSTNKKIVFTGPPDVGKTTIKEVFFDHSSPISLLENPLKPSMGVNSSIYSTINNDLGIFDLAGQENSVWFSKKGKEIFNDSNIIICVFDIRNSLESIFQFLLKIFKLKQELQLYSCQIIAFLHKIDLRSDTYVNQKLKIIEDFILVQHPHGKDFEIYKTSVKKNHFFNTYFIISEILNIILEKNLFSGIKPDLQELEKELSVILNSEVNLKCKISDLVKKLNFNMKNLENCVKKLEELGFIKTFDECNSFQLTDNAYYFKVGLEKEFNTDEFLDKKIEIFHVFLHLKEKKTELLKSNVPFN